MTDLVRLEHPAERVAVVTLDHPERNNHGTCALIDRFSEALGEARSGGARVCVIASAVSGHWLEHACLRDLQALFTGRPASSSGIGWFTAQQELASPEMISIAAISGDCSGGGAEIGWACDLRLAEEQVHFSQPEVLMALPTGLGGTTRLARLIGRSAAAEMVLDGSPVSARRLYELGAVNRVVPTGRARESALDWACRLATRESGAVAALKQMLAASETLPLEQALVREQELFQLVARSPEGLAGMARVQARLDAGESIRELYEELANSRVALRE